ncbi:MAG: CorA family divalent cation transporter [Candidatus Paceibacterota bacterium]|jgi:magnesium transporter
MISRHKYKKLVWIDIESPTKDEIDEISREFKIPQIIEEEVINKTIRSKVDLYDNLIYLILHFPCSHTKEDSGDQEIDFIIGKDFLITVHYEFVNTLHEFEKKFEINSMLNKDNIGSHAGFLFFHIIKDLYRHLSYKLDDINNSLREIEVKIFEEKEREMVQAISNVNRKLLDFKQAIRFHFEILKSFEATAKRFFGEEFSYYLVIMIGEFNKVHNAVESHKEILNDLRDTNDSLLTSKTNRIIRTLTMLTFIPITISLIPLVFGMDVSVPFTQNPNAFEIILAIMIISVLIIMLIFKSKKWLR